MDNNGLHESTQIESTCQETSGPKENDLEPPAPKSPRLHSSQRYYSDNTQGTSFGLNFVTYQEYQALKTEHDNLKQELGSLRTSVMSEVKKSLFTQIDAVKKENGQLKEEICKLKRRIFDDSSRNETTAMNGSCDGDMTLGDQVKHLTAELASVKEAFSSQPPVPGQETLAYMRSVLNFYDQKLTPKSVAPVPTSVSTPLFQTQLSQTQLPRSQLPTLPAQLLPPKLPSSQIPKLPAPQLPLPQSLPSTPNVLELANGPGLSHLGGVVPEITAPPSFEDGLNPSNFSALQKNASSSDPFSRPVLLVAGRDVWVDSKQLSSVLRLTETRGGDDVAQFLLRRVVMLAFTVEELAYSRGQGIMSSTSLDTPHRRPLDPEKVAACKEFMKKWCYEHNLEEPSEKAVNTVITHQITYSRTKLKRMANKLKESDPSTNIPSTFDVSQYFPKEGEEDSSSQFSIKEEVLENSDYTTPNLE